jgi:O-methyltransferase
MSYARVLARCGVQAIRWPRFRYETRYLPPSEWSSMTRRYIGIADPSSDPRSSIVLTLLERALDLPGDLAECGVFQGHVALAMGLILKQQGSRKTLYALDSYQGFDEAADREATQLKDGIVNPLLKSGAFSGTSVALIERKIRLAGLSDVVKPVPGYFRDTLPRMLEREYCFVHLDCDLGASYQECLQYFYPRVVPGGYICFDEYRISEWPVTTDVIDRFFSDKPEKPVELSSVVNGRRSVRWHIHKTTRATSSAPSEI